MPEDLKLLIYLAPVILINMALVIWCLVDWSKRKKFRPPGKWVWLIIFLFIQYLGPTLYLIMGRDYDDD